jgi:hypothetical protein
MRSSLPSAICLDVRPRAGAILPAAMSAALTAAACSTGAPGGAAGSYPAENLFSDRGTLAFASAPLRGDAGVAIDPRRSLIITDQVITQRFSLQNVLDLLIAQSKLGQPAEQLFHELWDTQNPGPGLALGPHCDDQKVNGKPAVNGFPIECPRQEGLQAQEHPFSDPNANQAFFATALVNRFDLAPADGSTCGENRIIFARNSPSQITDGEQVPVLFGTARSFVIFESVIANPSPALGPRGCLPVEQFWARLSTIDDVNERGSLLYNYYFFGLPSAGVGPVLHIDNLGNSDTRTTGQVRTNGFMQGNPPIFLDRNGAPTIGFDGWMLKQFALRVDCTAGPCALRAMPRTVKVNPWAPLFDPNRTDPTALAFQAWFVTQVENLGLDDVNRFNYVVPDRFNAGQSESFPAFGAALVDGGPALPPQPPENDYLVQFEHGAPNNGFRRTLQAKLTAMGSPLTPEQIVARATALSCGGCHFISHANAISFDAGPQDLGFADASAVQFGNAIPFVHVSESAFEDPAAPPGQRQFRVSDALKSQFLPFRKAVLEHFLAQ